MNRPNFCGNCGYKFEPQDVHCPQCFRPVVAADAHATQTFPDHPLPHNPMPQNPTMPQMPLHPTQMPLNPVQQPTVQQPTVQQPTVHYPAPPPAAGAKSRSWTTGNTVIVVLLSLLLVGLVYSRFASQPASPSRSSSQRETRAPARPLAETPAAPRIRVGPSFTEVDAVMDGRRNDLTDAQVETYWQSVSGTLVTWEGEVTEVSLGSGGHIDLKCNPKTYTSDVAVSLDGTQVKKLPSINKSQRIRVRGILQGHGLRGYTISQARVVGL